MVRNELGLNLPPELLKLAAEIQSQDIKWAKRGALATLAALGTIYGVKSLTEFIGMGQLPPIDLNDAATGTALAAGLGAGASTEIGRIAKYLEFINHSKKR